MAHTVSKLFLLNKKHDFQNDNKDQKTFRILQDNFQVLVPLHLELDRQIYWNNLIKGLNTVTV